MEHSDNILEITDWSFKDPFYNTEDTPKIEYEYFDTGCEVSKKCVECPLPICKHDDPSWFTTQKTVSRNRELVKAIHKNLMFPTLTQKNIAEKFNVSISVVQRYAMLINTDHIDFDLIDIFLTFIDKRTIVPGKVK